ncbi:MAG: hypothetical protein ACFCU3_05805 [Verrucomicrobiales bacterium]
MKTRIFTGAQRLWRPGQRRYTLVSVVLMLVMAGLAITLDRLPTPWTSGMALRAQEGLSMRLNDYVQTMSWYAAGLNLILVALLLLTQGWWLRALIKSPGQVPQSWGTPFAWLAIAGAAVVLLLSAWPRLDHSLWGDEAYSFRRFVHGFYEQKQPGEVEFREVRWRETLWGYRNPNNHILYSIVARPVVEAAAKPEWDWGRLQTAVRLPALLGGIGGIVVIALLLIRLGHTPAAVIAAWLLALHPWYLRYASEARGYGLIFFLLPLTLWLAMEAMRRPHWRWWAGFGLAQCLLLYTLPAMMYFLVVLNIVTMLILVKTWLSCGEMVPLLRWLVGCLAGGMLFVQMFAPCIPQLLEYLDRDRAQAEMTWNWVADAGSLLLSGMVWSGAPGQNALILGLNEASLGAKLFFLVIVPTFMVFGALRLVKDKRCWLAASLTIPVVLSVAISGYQGMLMYLWYVVYAVPSVAFLFALGVETLGRRIPTLIPRLVAMAPALLPFTFLAQAQRDILRSHPIEAQRESVALARPWEDPLDSKNESVITVSLIMAAVTYDPWARPLQSVDELELLVEEAGREVKPLFINLGQIGLARARFPELMEEIENAERFELVQVFQGMEPFTTRHVYRWKGLEEKAAKENRQRKIGQQ